MDDEDKDQFEDDVLYRSPSILDQININDISIDEDTLDIFLPPSYEGFNENLAEKLPESVLGKISARLLDDIENDIISRKDWESGLSEILLQLGIKIDKRTFPFDGACGTYSPIVMKTVFQFYVNAIPEILPQEGPVKQHIVGNITDEIEAIAENVERWVNYYFTQEAPEFYFDFKKMIMWLALIGDTVRKVYFDPILKRPTSQFIMPQDFIVKYGTTNLDTCERMTERKTYNKMEISEYQKMGKFRDVDIFADEEGEGSELKKTIDRIEGMTVPNYEDNTEFTIYESHVHLDIAEIEEEDVEGETFEANRDLKNRNYRPYIVTVDKTSRKILGLYRNWKEGDKDYNREDVYINYFFAEGLGFYGFGAAHLIGGLADASTKLLRQTIDGQTLSNFPGGLRSKGMRAVDNNLRIGPTEFIEIDTGGLPIQQAVMPMPYKEPSVYINELKKELEGEAANIMGAANAQIADFNPNIPVGTTYAMLGLTYKVQSTIIRGILDSMSQEFRLFYKLFAKHLPDEEYEFDSAGGSFVIKADYFRENINIVPIADPHVTSEVQRLMRSQLLVDNANQAPDLHDRHTAYEMFYESLKLTKSQIEKLLPPKEELRGLDPLTENKNILQGKSAKAEKYQDRQSHRIIHGLIMSDPTQPPEIKAIAQAHDAEHAAFEFEIQMEQISGIQMPENPYELPIEMQNQIAMQVAQAIMAQQQQQQEQMPPPPLDPALVMLEEVKVKDKGIDEKAKADQLKAQTEAFKAQLNYEAEMKKIEVNEKELELKSQGLI